jgi:hypothetical protein
MQRFLRGSLILVIAAALQAAGVGQAAKPRLTQMAWMAGNWNGTLDGNVVERNCSEPKGDSMICMMRVIAGDKVAWLEFSVMRETADGIVLETRFFTGNGQPSAPTATELRVKSATADEVVFENPNGTQPKSESVIRTGPDSMSSHADLVDSKGKASSMEMIWMRIH